MESIIIEKVFKAPAEKIWSAITEREQMKKWYFDFPAAFKPEVGSEFEWMAGPPDEKQWLHRGKVTDVIDGKKLSHTWEYPGYSGLATITWELFPVDANSTRLVFSQFFDIPFDPKEEELRRENFVAGWNSIIQTSLKEFLEK